MKKILLTLFLLVIGVSAYEITQAKELYLIYNTKIKPHFEAQNLHYFTSFDGLKIAYKYFPVKNHKATIVISSGRTEGMIKYPEMIYDLNRNGYSVYIYDHRGQGFSSRMTKDTQLGYVKNFFDYVKDMKKFVDNFVIKDDKKLFLLSHSMGGEIASLYIEQYPNDFDAVVMSSPMNRVKFASNFICKFIQNRVKDTPRYILGQKSYDDTPSVFKGNLYTHSKLRFYISREAFSLNPSAKIGGPSVRWVSEACKVSNIVIREANRIKIKVLLIQAGEDKIVSLKAQKLFCKNIGKLCKLVKIDDAKHELFIEKDFYRNKALSAMFEFFDNNLIYSK